MQTFETRSGSVYEVDENTKQIRRISGKTPCHRTFQPEGAWKPYESYRNYVNALVINWNDGTATITSVLV